ncbi:alpha-mannosidase [Caldicoprobacter faecalis]|uniref:Alpha-mannosidase n=1 Tax=Caldicoprobacter faecalis TaxID=937334 RepID=A0A1I5SC52_9FIRM|nr:alpha-mannosidase [Caldicoprobacter faecalis]SFP68299.1 alpha-mannosidase [Caldicoprobacter faecalis]
MEQYLKKLREMRKNKDLGYWGSRILSQLEYGLKLSEVKDHQFDGTFSKAIDFVYGEFSKEGVITRSTCQKAEEMMAELSQEAKRFKIICAAHAHIDMNWMWRWDETVMVTLDTFRTVLNLMKEYPDFTFSQSQASVYKILEDYAPEMLGEVKSRVKEGRWEVTASTWVEADKNMPNGESMARHILYTKRYLSRLLDIDPEILNLDFEPDTFGHSQNVPEILRSGGVKYYYHCRGYEGPYLYKWVAPSGKYIIAYREPFWYNAEIRPDMALYVPKFCTQHNLDTMLKVYGVGDHGGGPTRRDLERIIDMNTWPVFPQIRFGTFADFYRLVESIADELPEVKGERNFIFTGCYTSQSRIKMANRISEAALNEAEMFNAFSSFCAGYRYDGGAFESAWRNVLFNQFHDIIPGSGTIDTREYAMGLFQNTMAIANSRRSLSLQAIAAQIDTSKFIVSEEDDKDSVSEGAGAGFGAAQFKVTQSERGRGKTRIFHVFNPAPVERDEAAEIVVWDWLGDVDRMVFRDAQGNKVEHQVLDKGFNSYWGHHYMSVLIKARVPACGYNTYILTEDDEVEAALPFPRDPRVEGIDQFVLENDHIRAVFSSRDASIVSLIDKATGEEFIKGSPAGIFRLIEEDHSKGGTAWVVGRHMNVIDLTRDVKIKKVTYGAGNIRQSIAYECSFRDSSLKVTVSLDYNSPVLRYDVQCDWHEVGKPGISVPQLSFYMPLGYECSCYKYDIPFGTIEREGMDRDVPANSWALGVRKQPGGKSVMLVTDSKYGFRCVNNSMSITLIRSSYDPDPYPEFGIHKFSFAVCLVDNDSNRELIQRAYNFNHPLSVISSCVHKGSLPASGSFMRLEKGDVVLSAVKMAEEQGKAKRVVVRVYETEGKAAKVVLRLWKQPVQTYYVDLNECRIDNGLSVSIDGACVSFEVQPYSVASICVEFEE